MGSSIDHIILTWGLKIDVLSASGCGHLAADAQGLSLALLEKAIYLALVEVDRCPAGYISLQLALRYLSGHLFQANIEPLSHIHAGEPAAFRPESVDIVPQLGNGESQSADRGLMPQ